MSAPVNNGRNNNNSHPLPPVTAASPAFSSAEAINNVRPTILPQVSSATGGSEPPSRAAREQWLHSLAALGKETESIEGKDESVLQDQQDRIIDALATMSKQDPYPISLEEMRALAKLMDNLGHFSPKAEDIEKVMEGIEFLFKKHRTKWIKPMEESLTTLLSKVAQSPSHLCNLCPDTAAYRIIRHSAAEGELGMAGKIAFILHNTVEKICLYPYENPDKVDIADAVYFVGLCFAFPVQLEKNAIWQNFQTLAKQLCPGQDHQSKTLNDLVCLFFQQFERVQPDCEDIANFFSGLKMLATSGEFTGFSQPDAGEKLDHLLERFVTCFEETEDCIVSEFSAELLSVLSTLAEKQLLPRFKTSKILQKPWLDQMIRMVEFDDHELTIRQTIMSLGKLSRLDRIPHLSQDGKNHLLELIAAELIFTLKCDKIPDEYSDFLYELGALLQARVIQAESIRAYETFYQMLLVKLMDRTKNSFQDVAKVQFFYNILQEIFSRPASQGFFTTSTFQHTKQAENARHCALLGNLQGAMMRWHEQRQLQGTAVVKRKWPRSNPDSVTQKKKK